MKKNVIFFIAIIVCEISYAQQKCDWANIQWITPIEKPKGRYVDAKYKEGNLEFTYKHRGSYFFYEYLSDDLTNPGVKINKSSITTKHENEKGRSEFIKLINFEDKIWALTKIVNGAEKKFHFYVQEIDIDNRQVLNEPIEILSQRILEKARHVRVVFIENDSKNKMMVAFQDAIDKPAGILYKAKVYSPSWQLLDEEAYKMSKKEWRRGEIFFGFDSEDNIVAAKKIGGREEVTNKWKIWNYRMEGGLEATVETEIASVESIVNLRKYEGLNFDLETEPESEVETNFEFEGGVESVGLYDNADYETVGVAYWKFFDSEEKRDVTKKYPFEDGSLKSNDYGFYQTSKAIRTKDGFYVMAEKSVKEETRYVDDLGNYKPKQSSWRTDFLDIMVAHLDLNGKLIWVSKVPRTVKMVGNYFENPNLEFTVVNGEVVILYEKLEKLLSFSQTSRTDPDPELRGDMYVAMLDEEGEAITGLLISKDNKEMKKVKIVKQLEDSGNFLVSRLGERGIQYGIVSIN